MADAARSRILLVDDDVAITDALAGLLERSGFEVRVAADGRAGLAEVERDVPDLVVCDVLMPHVDGREFVRRMRARALWLPIILLTQVGESWERSAALDEGADDYLNKPFDPHELIARIRAVLRRTTQDTGNLRGSVRLSALDMTLDRTARRVRRGDAEVALTPKALMLLEYLMLHPQEVHSRERLLATLWGYDFTTSSRAVDHRVAELRRALMDTQQSIIETAQSAGYRFAPNVTPA